MFLQQWFNLNTSSPHAFFQSLIVGLWFNVAASGVVAVILYITVLKKILFCKEKWCFRVSHHRVEGTHYKTCPKHTTNEIHKKWRAHHKKNHPEAHRFLNK